MFEEVQKIVASVAAILSSVETGKGIAGAVVVDSSLRDDLTGIIGHLEGIAADADAILIPEVPADCVPV